MWAVAMLALMQIGDDLEVTLLSSKFDVALLHEGVRCVCNHETNTLHNVHFKMLWSQNDALLC